MTTNQAPQSTPTAPKRSRERRRGAGLRRMLGVTMTSAALAVGGAAAIPATTAQAAGVQANQLTHVATLTDGAAPTTSATLSDTPRFGGMRLRVTADGRVEQA